MAGSNTVMAESTHNKQWMSEHYRDHLLVGKIWSSREKAFVSEENLLASLKNARFVLLGETHPNRDHHLLQARFLEEVAKASKGRAAPRSRVVVEMIPERFGPRLRAVDTSHPVKTAKLGEILEWQKRGWGKWEHYRPIFDTAYASGLEIVPGNLDRDATKKIGRQGLAAVDDKQKRKLFLDVTYTKAQSGMLTDMLFESHCKMVPKTALAPMQLVQQARDGIMAGQMLGAPANSVAVLIAGSGHVRNDWAVPRILRAKAPDNGIVTVSFVEVAPDQDKPQDYEPPSADKSPVFDFLYFTPKSEIKDHCAELIKQFKKRKSK